MGVLEDRLAALTQALHGVSSQEARVLVSLVRSQLVSDSNPSHSFPHANMQPTPRPCAGTASARMTKSATAATTAGRRAAAPKTASMEPFFPHISHAQLSAYAAAVRHSITPMMGRDSKWLG